MWGVGIKTHGARSFQSVLFAVNDGIGTVITVGNHIVIHCLAAKEHENYPMMGCERFFIMRCDR